MMQHQFIQEEKDMIQHEPEYFEQDNEPISIYKDIHYVQPGPEPGLLHLSVESVFFDTAGSYTLIPREGIKKKSSHHNLNDGVLFEYLTEARQANEPFRWFFVAKDHSRATFTVHFRTVFQPCTLVVGLNHKEHVATLHLTPKTTSYTFEADIVADDEEFVNNLEMYMKETFSRRQVFTAFELTHVTIETVVDTGPEPRTQEPNLYVCRAMHKPSATHVHFWSTKVKRPTAWVMGMRPLEMQDGCFSPMATPGQYMGFGFQNEHRPGKNMVFSVNNFSKRETPPPKEDFSQILAIGNPIARFSTYGHEGTGSKADYRQTDIWATNQTGQFFTALVEVETIHTKPNGKLTYHRGFWFDESTDRWRFFADFDKFVPRHKQNRGLKIKTFMEVIGSSGGKRTGHHPRKIEYEAMAYGKEIGWRPVNRMDYPSMRRRKSLGLSDKFRGVGANGRFWASTGGMKHQIKTRASVLSSNGPNYNAAQNAPRAIELKDQIFEEWTGPTIDKMELDETTLSVTLTIPPTPYCCLGDTIDQATEKHKVEFHMGPQDMVILRRQHKVFKRPTRRILSSNWPQIYEHSELLTQGTHTIQVPRSSLELVQPEDDLDYLETPNVPVERTEGAWFVKLYVGNSLMQFTSRTSASVQLS